MDAHALSHLMLFTSDCPLQTEELLQLQGVLQPQEFIQQAQQEGLIEKEDKAWRLSSKGKIIRDQLLQENFLPLEGPDCLDQINALKSHLFFAYLQTNVGINWKFTLIEPRYRFSLPLVHKILPGYQLNPPQFTWMESEQWTSTTSTYPRWDGTLPRPQAPESAPSCAESWQPDLLVLNFYEYDTYRKLPHKVRDHFNLVNAHRMFVSFNVQNLSDAMAHLSLLGQALATQRQILNPGYFDFDENDGDSFIMVLYVTENAQQEQELINQLSPVDSKLLQHTLPLVIGTINMDRMRKPQRPYQTIYGWWHEEVHQILTFP